MTDLIDERISQIAAWSAPGFENLLGALLAHGRTVYVVGGNVRDFLLGADGVLNDLDLVMEAPVLDVARQVADQIGWAFYPLDGERDVARLVKVEGSDADAADSEADRLICDIAALRGTLHEDLRTRDFTVNALALALTRDAPPQLIDVVDGVADLGARRLRPFTEANLEADPVRLLRAVRFAHKFGLHIDDALAAAMRRLAPLLQSVSPERMRDEVWKITLLSDPAAALMTMQRLDLLDAVLPELSQTAGVSQTAPHHLDVFGHTLLAMNYAADLRDWLQGKADRLDPALREVLAPWQEALHDHFDGVLSSGRRRAPWLVWHALCHDLGKPATRSQEIDESGLMRARFFEHEEVGAELTARRLMALRFSRLEIQLAQSRGGCTHAPTSSARQL